MKPEVLRVVVDTPNQKLADDIQRFAKSIGAVAVVQTPDEAFLNGQLVPAPQAE